MPILLPELALIFIVLTIVLFFFQRGLFGIQPYIFEGIGCGLIGLQKGFFEIYSTTCLFLLGIIFAGFFDPLIWKRVCADSKDIDPISLKKFSFYLNGMMALILVGSFAVGRAMYFFL